MTSLLSSCCDHLSPVSTARNNLTMTTTTPNSIVKNNNNNNNNNNHMSGTMTMDDLTITNNDRTEQEGDHSSTTGGMDEEAKVRYELYLASRTDHLIRLDISYSLMKDWTELQKSTFINELSKNQSIKTIHLSGKNLENVLSKDQIEQLVVNGIGRLYNLQELFIFHGNCIYLTEDLIARCLQKASKVKVLMLWEFAQLTNHSPTLAGTLRTHPSIERITLNLPSPNAAKNKNVTLWSQLDIYVMAMASMSKLKVLQIRCEDNNNHNVNHSLTNHHRQHHQEESLISPEAMVILMNSKTIESLYLENIGLDDEHIDAMVDELISNVKTTTPLKLIDFKHNAFSEDVLYTVGQKLLPNNKTIQSIDISGVTITNNSGIALASGIINNNNTTLLHLELEGIYDNYKDEFHIPDGHKYDPWMININYQLRLNRAYHSVGNINTPCSLLNRRRFVDAINHVSDHIGCIYHLLRTHSTLINK